MSRTRGKSMPLGIALLLILLCISLVGLLWAFQSIPRQARQVFGPPSPALTSFQGFTYSFQLLLHQADLLEPRDANGIPAEFQVSLGESVTSVANRLEEEGLVRSGKALRLYLIYAGLDMGVQAGAYELSPAWNALEIARLLQNSTPKEVNFTLFPGWRAEEIAAALPLYGLEADSQEFIRLAHQPNSATLPDGFPDLPSLEGFLFPGEYRLQRGATPAELLQVFAAGFDENVSLELRDAFENQGLSILQAVTLASMVQREAIMEEEQPMIASVFFNRLQTGMNLGSDPTVQYALGYNSLQQTWWTNPLSLDDLATESPYNTYIHAGLPPGPICSPALAALRAVAYPAQSPYYYFQARCDGSGYHNFAVTFEEHLDNSCE